LETGLRDAVFADMRLLIEGLFNDRTLVSDSEPARPLEVIHKDRSAHVQTLFGRIELRRQYYYHTKAHTGRHPLDHALDLVRGNTPGIARIICRASAQSASYEAAAKDIHAYTGQQLHGRNFGRFIAQVMPELRQANAALPAPPKSAPAIPILYVGSDGTGVPLRRSELLGVKGRQSDGSARTREAKLGCVFTQTSTDSQGNPQRDANSTTYVGTFEDCRALGTLLRAEALRRGYARAQRTVYLGDGAAWIWENARLNFPDAVQILDFYHASEHLGELARALHGAGERAKSLQSTWCHELKAQSAAPIIEQAQRQLEAQRGELSAEAIASSEREIAYLSTNLERTRYGRFRAQGYFIGSGVVEAGCKTVVGRRLKQSGMFWSHRGGDDLLALRCMILGPSFSEIWQARLPILRTMRAKAPKWSRASN
jgi:Uncharacterised protein family (UPF0236)